MARGKASARSAATAMAIAQAAPSPRQQQQQQQQQPYYLTTASPGTAVTFSADPEGDVTAPAVPAAAASARPFDVLMDTFSLHEFMIRVGRAVTETPEYESYRRSYEPLWDVISVLVVQVGVGV